MTGQNDEATGLEETSSELEMIPTNHVRETGERKHKPTKRRNDSERQGYKVDRLSRSLFDFAQTMRNFDANGDSFVSVTQQFNTTNSMGRLTLNILLSFAQFEREIISERISDKIAAQRQQRKAWGVICCVSNPES